mgnify:CR=1 FL=1
MRSAILAAALAAAAALRPTPPRRADRGVPVVGRVREAHVEADEQRDAEAARARERAQLQVEQRRAVVDGVDWRQQRQPAARELDAALRQLPPPFP